MEQPISHTQQTQPAVVGAALPPLPTDRKKKENLMLEKKKKI